MSQRNDGGFEVKITRRQFLGGGAGLAFRFQPGVGELGHGAARARTVRAPDA